jgi:hypothetical protein
MSSFTPIQGLVYRQNAQPAITPQISQPTIRWGMLIIISRSTKNTARTNHSTASAKALQAVD